jgi:hypothetical protein
MSIAESDHLSALVSVETVFDYLSTHWLYVDSEMGTFDQFCLNAGVMGIRNLIISRQHSGGIYGKHSATSLCGMDIQHRTVSGKIDGLSASSGHSLKSTPTDQHRFEDRTLQIRYILIVGANCLEKTGKTVLSFNSRLLGFNYWRHDSAVVTL